MKTRTLKELYQLVLNGIKEEKRLFICNLIESLRLDKIITNEEYVKLINHFLKQRPTKTLYPEIFKNSTYKEVGNSWFGQNDKNPNPTNKETKRDRIKLLTLIIDRLESPKI